MSDTAISRQFREQRRRLFTHSAMASHTPHFDVETVSAGVVNSNCTSEANKLYAKVRVTNTGKFSGKEVVQVYIAKPQGKLGKPAKELADL